MDNDEDGDDMFRVPKNEAKRNVDSSSNNHDSSSASSSLSAAATAAAAVTRFPTTTTTTTETVEKVTLHPGRSYADVNWETQLGVTALMAASECGHMENIIALVELGANINYKSERRGLSALMVAARHGNETVAVYLLDHGAIINAKDRSGRDAKEWAHLCGHHKLSNVLESQAWRWKRAEVRKNAGKKLWTKLKLKSKAFKMSGDWSIHVDPTSCVDFYINNTTGASQWEMPASILKKNRASWHSKVDPVTKLTYYYNDAGERTYTMPAILNKHWRSKTRPRSELNKILSNLSLSDTNGRPIQAIVTTSVEDINNEVLDNLIQRSKRNGIVSVPHVGESIDGYKGIRRILSVSAFMKNDAMSVTKVEWDARVGGVRGRESALHRCQQASSEYSVDFHKGVLGYRLGVPYPAIKGGTSKGVFVGKIVPHTQAAAAARLKVGHWVEWINATHVRDMDSRLVAQLMDEVERPFRIKFKIPMIVCDYCANTSPHTVCITCNAILCMNCIVASNHSIRHPNHRCKTILQIGKEMTVLIPAATTGTTDGTADGTEEEYRPKVSFAHLQTLSHSLNQVVAAAQVITKVLGPAHDEWRLNGGERYMSLEDREKREAEKRRQQRAQMVIYATPPEHQYAIWASGMSRHAEARAAMNTCIQAQEKRLAGIPPIVAPLAASYGLAATIESNAGDRQGAIKCLLQSLTLMDPNEMEENENDVGLFNKQFDKLSFYLSTYGMIPLSEMLDSGQLAEQHALLPLAFKRAEVLEQKRERELMVEADVDAKEKPITLSDAQNPRDVEEMLNDKGGAALFEEFCVQESIDHYVKFWLKIKQFKKLERMKVPIDPELGRKERSKLKKLKRKAVENGTSAIPDGWQALYDESVSGNGTPYYYNESTGETSWDRPPPVTPRDEQLLLERILLYEEKPKKMISSIYAHFIMTKQLQCLTMHHYDELIQRASHADYDYEMFDHSQRMVFDVLMEVYRRFLTSSLGSRYLWKKLLTNRLKMGLIHAQAVARGWLQYRHTIARRALMLRAYDLAAKLNGIKKHEIKAAIALQTMVRGWMARIKTDRARRQLHRLWLLEAYTKRALRVESVTMIQQWIRTLKHTWNDVQLFRGLLCNNIIRTYFDPNKRSKNEAMNRDSTTIVKEDGSLGDPIYYDVRTKKRYPRNRNGKWKPTLMKAQQVPCRELCTCNKGYVQRWCIQCKTLECDACFTSIARHGPDTLEDDLDAAELLGTASFRMEVPMHRHGWCAIPGGFPHQKFDGTVTNPIADMCETCLVRVGSARATDAENVSTLLCRECKKTLVEVSPDVQMVPVDFRTRHRGMDDLDSDEEGAYDNWPTPRPNADKEEDW